MHDPSRASTDRDRADLEAESVAFVVCAAVGVQTDDYSLPYVARWFP